MSQSTTRPANMKPIEFAQTCGIATRTLMLDVAAHTAPSEASSTIGSSNISVSRISPFWFDSGND